MSVSHARNWIVVVVSVALVGVWASGCGRGGPALGGVEGTVTLDGTPVEGATVTFSPVEGGRSATAITDSAGHYRLEFTADQMGAIVGKHKVSISTFEEGELDDRGQRVGAVAEKIPAKYNRESTLVAEVKSGSQTIDFPLVSQ